MYVPMSNSIEKEDSKITKIKNWSSKIWSLDLPVCEIQTNQTFFLNLKHVKEINK